jgi:hypothetical protein
VPDGNSPIDDFMDVRPLIRTSALCAFFAVNSMEPDCGGQEKLNHEWTQIGTDEMEFSFVLLPANFHHVFGEIRNRLVKAVLRGGRSCGQMNGALLAVGGAG